MRRVKMAAKKKAIKEAKFDFWNQGGN